MTETPDTADRSTMVCERLKETTVPAVDADLVTANVVTQIDCHDGETTVVVDYDAEPELSRDEVMTTIGETVENIPGVETVDVRPAIQGPDLAGNVEDFDRVIAVASAKGGVGKSTVATHLAMTLAADGDVAIFDADVHGPNVPRLLDVDGPVYSTDEGNPIPIPYDGLEVMSVGLLQSSVPLAWRGAMAHDAVSQLFSDTAWRSTDTLVIDLPPGTGDVVLTTLQEIPIDGMLVVTTPFHTSITDTNRTIELFRDEGIPVLGAVVNMAELVCECCGESNELYADRREELTVRTLVELPFDQTLQERPTAGDVPETIADLATAVKDELDSLDSFTVPEDAVDIRGLPARTRRQRVRESFMALDSGAEFTLVSDRDPSPVREFLASLVEVDPATVTPFTVERKTPETWLLTTTRP